jgi:hypothetical protein
MQVMNSHSVSKTIGFFIAHISFANDKGPPSGLYAPWTPGTEVSTVDMTRSPKPPSRDVWQHYDVDDNGESASFDQESCADGKACAGQDQGSNMKIPTFDIMTLLREKLDAEMT